MLRFQKILFPVDFSERCVQTAPYVASIARKFNSRVILLHAFDAYDPFGHGAFNGAQRYASPIPVLWEQRQTAMASFGQTSLDGLSVERVTEDGEPGERIPRYARNHGIDLIVMPTHGYGGFRRLVLGSVTAKVLHDAPCAIWTTAHCEEFGERYGQCITSMVCGLDLGQDSVCLVRRASEIAEEYNAELRLIHAVGSDLLREGAPFQRFLMDIAVERLTAVQQEAHTHFRTCVKQGDVADVIRDLITGLDARLCIVGRGHANKRLGLLRTHVNAIVRESPCPVLSL